MINRIFFFIRKLPETPFYYETTNYYEKIEEHLKNIDPEIKFSSGKVNDLVHYYKFSHPGITEFKKVTQQMYFDGDLKQEFKKCMRYTKDNKIAFALAAVNEDVLAGPIQRLHYYNVKPNDKQFIDATYSQKVALGLYDKLVGLDELVFTINFFDYDHNVKHVENRLVDLPGVWDNLRKAQAETCPLFMEEKNEYNAEHGITEGKKSERNVYGLKQYTPEEVNEFLPEDLQTLVLDLAL
jgi:hypothetical protein